jgi:hypothetical protein
MPYLPNCKKLAGFLEDEMALSTAFDEFTTEAIGYLQGWQRD